MVRPPFPRGCPLVACALRCVRMVAVGAAPRRHGPIVPSVFPSASVPPSNWSASSSRPSSPTPGARRRPRALQILRQEDHLFGRQVRVPGGKGEPRHDAANAPLSSFSAPRPRPLPPPQRDIGQFQYPFQIGHHLVSVIIDGAVGDDPYSACPCISCLSPVCVCLRVLRALLPV